jgi:hypothetical protein
LTLEITSLEDDGFDCLSRSGVVQLRDAWRATLENTKLRCEGESPLIESHLAKYRSLMPSLALLFHLIELVDRNATGPVSIDATRQAVAWCEYLESHVRRIYQASFEGDPEPAGRLLGRIRSGSVSNPFAARDVVNKGWSGLSKTEEVDRAVAVLEAQDWVKTITVRTSGRPRTEIHVNPLAYQEPTR